MKRSVNFTGSRATVSCKAAQPKSIIAAFRHLGMTDGEIAAKLREIQARQQKPGEAP
jgi:hypothetical protein